MFSPFQSSCSSQMPCLSCPSRVAMPFGEFYMTHHSPISYVLYFDKALPDTASPFYTLHSACCWSPHNLEKPLLGTVQHIENECFPGCVSRTGSIAQFFSRRKKMTSSESFHPFAPRWEVNSCKSAHISILPVAFTL